MPRTSSLSRSKTLLDSASITSTPYLDFLLPTDRRSKRRDGASRGVHTSSNRGSEARRFESVFFYALSQTASCPAHRTDSLPKLRGNGLSQKSISSFSKTRSSALTSFSKTTPSTSALTAFRRLLSGAHGTRKHDPHRQRGEAQAGNEQASTPHRRRRNSIFFQPNFAARSHLPRDFYEDVENLQTAFESRGMADCPEEGDGRLPEAISADTSASLAEKLKLIKSVRQLEDKLAQAKAALHKSLDRRKAQSSRMPRLNGVEEEPTQALVLTKEDYLNLVDLYFYSHQSRFGPESPDHSPTPLFLDDYSFKLSADFSRPEADPDGLGEAQEEDISPLKHVEEMLKSRQLHEISIMRAFVELLLDDSSSNRALFEVYKRFPDPGVANLPPGVIRLFLQRMSTPWVRSERTMLRYLSLIDDMQRASLPITSAEWSSAIYLAGRSFATVTSHEVATSFRIWREMEEKAGVKSNHVTFNILFDIAVRAGKYTLGQTILKEMHDRGLRLNRLGRVSLIYYYGLSGDGDGVRKAYRDFIEAGEIVDTLVLNCVMASLINAQEPIAAEQVYERMKNLQTRLQKGRGEDSEDALFMKYPPPGSSMIDREMASNALGRTLLRAAHLRDVLPDHHADLQTSMPLTPDHVTFRTMIAHHASTSGDLDRLTVLMNDMTEVFELPLTSLIFQLLFKGFAVHGGSRSDQAKWTWKRLELVWTACREALKDDANSDPSPAGEAENTSALPTIQEVEAVAFGGSEAPTILAPRGAKKRAKKLGAWDEFVLDLGAFPRERLKPIHERKAAVLAEEGGENPFLHTEEDIDSGVQAASSPRGPVDDGDEYSLPSATTYSQPHRTSDQDADRDKPSSVDARVRLTRPLVVWLLRAYQRATNSRTQVEEVWFEVRRLWRPTDATEREAVVRVLRRALRDCDRLGNG